MKHAELVTLLCKSTQAVKKQKLELNRGKSSVTQFLKSLKEDAIGEFSKINRLGCVQVEYLTQS